MLRILCAGVAAWLCIALALAKPLTGIDADREEARLEKVFPAAPVADEYLAAIALRITEAAQHPSSIAIRIHAVRDDAPFVFALGNGATFVSTALLARMSNDSQVAALLAPEIASVIAPNIELEQSFDDRKRKHAGAKMLAVLATAGIAAFPLVKAENKLTNEQHDAVVLDNDKTALLWARAAGFDVAQGAVATQRLRDLLAREKISGGNRLSNAAGLETRTAQFTRAMQLLPVDLNTRPPLPDPVEPLRSLAHRLSLDQVRYSFDHSQRESILPQLDRIEQEFGANADSSCLRARFLRQQPASAQVTREVIVAYETCVAMPGAPLDNLKELAFLHRDDGNAAAAIRSFQKYLSLAPHAVDAPIIQGYIEELRAKH